MSFASFHHGSRLAESDETPALSRVSQTAVVGLLGTAPDADPAKFPLNTPVLMKGKPTDAAGLGEAGTLKNAVDDVYDQIGAYTIGIRVEEGVDAAATMSNLVGDATQLTGVHALKKAEAQLSIKPSLIAIPGYSAPTDPTVLNPVCAELGGVLDAIEAYAWVDGPDTTDEDAVAYAKLLPPGRMKLVDGKVLVWDTNTNTYVARPASARFAGVQAMVDTTLGFWHSESNKPIKGIGGVSRTVTYGAQSNYLNENKVATILNMGNGFITWGNRGSSNSSLWEFSSQRRTADFINEEIRRVYLQFVDKPFSVANLKFMLEAGNAVMRKYKALGAILGGRVWFDESLNEPTEMAAGKLTVGVDLEPTAPMEDIRAIAHRNIQYYLELSKEALKAAA